MAKTITTNPDGTAVTTFTGVDLDALKEGLAREAFGGGSVPAGHCRRCRQAFTDANVRSAAAWRETTLSKLCENCWDELFKEEE